MSDTAQDGHSSRTSASSIHQDGDLGDGSESESYVEVEQLGEDMMAGPANFTTLTAATSPARSPPCNIVRHVTKRTLITLHQRSVLEEYYRNGMTSASQQLAEVHEQVAAKTGLDLSVVRVRKSHHIFIFMHSPFANGSGNASKLPYATSYTRVLWRIEHPYVNAASLKVHKRRIEITTALLFSGTCKLLCQLAA